METLMKTLVAAIALALTTSAFAENAAPPAAAATQASTMTEKQKIGYAIGLQVGSKLKGIDVDSAAIAAGVRDAATGAKPQISEKEVMEAMQALQKQFMAAQNAAAGENQKAGEAFLAENAKKEGVKTTASGLQYKVIKSGSGKTPKATDTVSVNYKGTLISGKEFDASQGEPITFPVKGVIPGWTEVLQLMKEGDKWMVYIPSKLAYGENSPGGAIGPNETLIFEVELVAVK
jgi:FKBP-type peptidyl-prolyl cis-trans isomerase FklB